MSEQAVLTLERGGHPSVGARLDRLPIVRSHRTITAVVGVGLFFDFFDGTPNAAWLIVTRFLAGLGIGAETALSDCYLAEVVAGLPPRPVRRLDVHGGVLRGAGGGLRGAVAGAAEHPRGGRLAGAVRARRGRLGGGVGAARRLVAYYGFGTLAPQVLAVRASAS